MSAGLFHEKTATGQDKIKRYGWTIKNEPGTLVALHKNQLRVNEVYQRNAITDKVRKIAANFSWIGFGVLIIGERSGEYWIIDGQHRYLAAMRRSDITYLPCIVFQTANTSQEATGFLDCNTLRKGVTATAKHKAMVVANDEVAVKLQGLFDELGLEVSDGGRHRQGRITCVRLCYTLAKENFEEFKVLLAEVKQISEMENLGMPDKLISGLWYLHKNCDGGITETRIAKRIRQVGAQGLTNAAIKAATFYTVGGPKIWATGILQELNKGMKNKFSAKKLDV